MFVATAPEIERIVFALFDAHALAVYRAALALREAALARRT
jgi:hypothetical protein